MRKENKSIINVIGFPIQNLRIICALLRPKYFEGNLFDLRKITINVYKKSLNVTLYHNLPLPKNFDGAFKICYIKIHKPWGKIFSLKLNKICLKNQNIKQEGILKEKNKITFKNTECWHNSLPQYKSSITF